MNKRTCAVEGCMRSIGRGARGYCSSHYYRWWRYGDPEASPPPRPDPWADLEGRFWSKVTQATSSPESCWIWGGAPSNEGYGTLRFGGKRAMAHRFSYELMIGPIPAGLHIDHLCRTRLCVNPWHLDPVPSGVNTLRGQAPAAINARKVCCIRGHPFGPESVRPGGGRACRICRSDDDRERYRRRVAAQQALKSKLGSTQ